MEPLISVIVPIYNVEKYLQECVDSILNQTYTNLEVILVDDGSPDGCPAICDEYAARDKRVNVIHIENGGVVSARNLGLSQASGEYIIFVDSDDWLDKKLIQDIAIHFPCSMAIFGCTKTDEVGNSIEVLSATLQSRIISVRQDEKIWKQLFQSSLVGYACNKIYNRKLLDNVSFPLLPEREDLLFNLEILSKVDQVLVICQNGYYYRQHSESLLHRNKQRFIPNYFEVAERLIDAFEQIGFQKGKELLNLVLKTYLTDVVYRYIKTNGSLDTFSQRNEVEKLFTNKKIRKYVSIRYNTCFLNLFFSICYKLYLPTLFWRVWVS